MDKYEEFHLSEEEYRKVEEVSKELDMSMEDALSTMIEFGVEALKRGREESPNLLDPEECLKQGMRLLLHDKGFSNPQG